MEISEGRWKEEQRWIERCCAGDTAPFRLLVERYERMVRSVIYRLVGSMQDVEEIAQETFVTAFENLMLYAAEARFSTWLCQIALNKSRDALRARRRRDEAVDIDGIELPSDADGPEDVFEQRQRSAQLQRVLSQLKDRDREVIVLKYLSGLSYEEIARIHGCSEEAAKVRGHRAREELKRVLQHLGIKP